MKVAGESAVPLRAYEPWVFVAFQILAMGIIFIGLSQLAYSGNIPGCSTCAIQGKSTLWLAGVVGYALVSFSLFLQLSPTTYSMMFGFLGGAHFGFLAYLLWNPDPCKACLAVHLIGSTMCAIAYWKSIVDRRVTITIAIVAGVLLSVLLLPNISVSPS